MRGTGSVSPSVMSAVRAGAQPSNSAATRARAVFGSVKSMLSIHAFGLVSAT
jgi:hypothetical protein